MDSKNFKVGDKVWFWDFGTDQPDSGIVVKIDKCVKPLTSDLSPYAKLQIDDSIFYCERYFDQLFSTKEEVMSFTRNNRDKYIEGYKSEIKNVNDLIEFMYNHPICKNIGQYTDIDARFAAKEKAKELLGIDLDY